MLRATLRCFLLIHLPMLSAFVIVAYLCIQHGLSVADLTRDPIEITKAPPHISAFCFVGVMLWCASATTHFLSGIAFRDAPTGFFVGLGSLSTLLMLDDIFMIHERHLQRGLGIPELFTIGCYGLLLLFTLIRHRQYVLKQTPFLLLFSGLAFFAASVISDKLGLQIPNAPEAWAVKTLLEDLPKLMGICSWFGYAVLVFKSNLTRPLI